MSRAPSQKAIRGSSFAFYICFLSGGTARAVKKNSWYVIHRLRIDPVKYLEFFQKLAKVILRIDGPRVRLAHSTRWPCRSPCP